MMQTFRQMLAGLSLVGGAMVVPACIDTRSREPLLENSRVDVQRTGFTAITPETSSWCDAANPLGWADEAERRAAEAAFARGEEAPVEPPSAIGGGPNLDE